jgi:hypothetical protein
MSEELKELASLQALKHIEILTFFMMYYIFEIDLITIRSG